MYPEKIEQLIKSVIADGVITEKERAVLHKQASAYGIDEDELDVYVDGLLCQPLVTKETKYLHPDKFQKWDDGECFYYRLMESYETTKFSIDFLECVKGYDNYRDSDGKLYLVAVYSLGKNVSSELIHFVNKFNHTDLVLQKVNDTYEYMGNQYADFFKINKDNLQILTQYSSIIVRVDCKKRIYEDYKDERGIVRSRLVKTEELSRDDDSKYSRKDSSRDIKTIAEEFYQEINDDSAFRDKLKKKEKQDKRLSWIGWAIYIILMIVFLILGLSGAFD